MEGDDSRPRAAWEHLEPMDLESSQFERRDLTLDAKDLLDALPAVRKVRSQIAVTVMVRFSISFTSPTSLPSRMSVNTKATL